MGTKQFKPHLATDVNLDSLEFPVVVQTKFDGCRMMVRDGVATGRSLKQYKNKALTEFFSNPLFNGLDGELCHGELNDPDLCRKTTSCTNSINGELPKLWVVFDYIDETNKIPFVQRMEIARLRVKKINETLADEPNAPIIDTAMTTVVHTMDDLLYIYQEMLDEGYEGIIIRDMYGVRKDGRSTIKDGAYLRLKPSRDEEAIVLSIEEAMQNNNEAKINELGHTERSSHKENKTGKGIAGTLVCEDVKTGKTIRVGCGKMTHKERELIFNNPEIIIGTMIKYRCLDKGEKDMPRFPRFISGEFLTERASEDI